MVAGRYLLVSDDPGDLVIRDGPFLWDETVALPLPDGYHAMLESAALAAGYRFPALSPEHIAHNTLTERVTAALAANADYLALSPPTNAQVAAQVTRLTRQSSGVIRLLLRAMDSTEGT